MERTENDRTVFRPSHKTLKIDETDFHIPTATTTTEQSFHSKPEKPVQTNGAAAERVTKALREQSRKAQGETPRPAWPSSIRSRPRRP
jgi:tRNA/tmRNA/rRNA uracil-C5-methylase (TrmA/RlmC/RlmD family)